jgi:hypothetical protein
VNISNLWRSLGIRGKINFILIPAMVPMLAIAVIGYLSHREASLSSSENVVDLVLDHGGEMINSFLAEQTDRFHRWSQEGIYGMAIEYDTTTELGDQFEEMLADAPGMALLVLADVQGRHAAGAGTPTTVRPRWRASRRRTASRSPGTGSTGPASQGATSWERWVCRTSGPSCSVSRPRA